MVSELDQPVWTSGPICGDWRPHSPHGLRRSSLPAQGTAPIIAAGHAEIMPTHTPQVPDSPNFTWDDKALATLLAKVRNRQGRLVGRMEALGFLLRSEAVLQTLTQDVVKSSEIEGEILDTDQVRSSLARRLGMN